MFRDVLKQGRRSGATSVSDVVEASVFPRDLLYRGSQKLLPLRDGWDMHWKLAQASALVQVQDARLDAHS